MLPTRGKVSRSLQKTGPDEKELALREDWYAAKEAWVKDGCPDSAQSRKHFDFVDEKLSRYLWERTLSEIEFDRSKHPKAKRNAVVGTGAKGGGGRYLP